MSDFITLSCPSCGNKLQITEDIDRFACAACGNEHIVNRTGGIVTLKPVIESITKVQTGVDKTASELAIVRLKEEIKVLEGEISRIMSQESCLSSMLGGLIGIFLYFIFAGVFITIVGFALIEDNGEYGIFIGLTMIGVPILLMIVGHSTSKADERSNAEKAKTLREKLDAKKQELAEHEKIVSKFH